MNDPIISPWVIYFIDISDSLIGASMFFAMASPVLIFFLMMAMIDCDKEKIAILKRSAKICGIVFIVASSVCTFMPNKNTIYKMIAASYITPDNIQATGELADKGIDYIGSKADKATDAAVEKIIRIIDAIKKEEKK